MFIKKEQDFYRTLPKTGIHFTIHKVMQLCLVSVNSLLYFKTIFLSDLFYDVFF